MSRRRRAVPRIIPPDPQYQDLELARFINRMMQRGKKTTAQRIIYNAFDIIREQSSREPLEVFQQAVRNVTPQVEVKPKRVGGATYQVPTELRPKRSEALGMRWIIRGARARKGMPMRRGLALELVEASRGEGSAVRRKEELHRMAEANRAFVHYRT
ncbi:MAG: 30S ribosomal protein S7 [Chloroflexi bacterium]|nr:30S ribosomal protein S7 [Chloroflexota bacterium]MCI0845640.1 30S ribosomal protein S7 [Chloroflexota bacterium]